MTTPRHAVDSGANGRYYTHPQTGQQLISVTNANGTSSSKPSLVPWAAKCAADAAWELLPLMINASRARTDCRDQHPKTSLTQLQGEGRLCGTCYGCLTRAIKNRHVEVRDKAADLGTAVHTHADAHVTGRQLEHDPDVAPFIDQYLRFLSDYDIDINANIEAAELTVARPAAGWAGTLDVIAAMKIAHVPGEGRCIPLEEGERGLWLIDIKTSLTRSPWQSFPENELQLAALRNASEMWLPDDTVKPFRYRFSGVATLQLRPDQYAFIPVPAGASAYKAFLAGVTRARWQHDEWPGDYDHRHTYPDASHKPKRQTRANTTAKETES